MIEAVGVAVGVSPDDTVTVELRVALILAVPDAETVGVAVGVRPVVVETLGVTV